jgi:hypothetical protein
VHVRLARLDERGIDQGQPFDAVSRATRVKRFDLRDLVRLAGDDQLPDASVRHLVPGAERVHRQPSLDAQPGLQRAGRIVDACVDHAAVVRAAVESGPWMPLEHAGGEAPLCDSARRRQTGDTAADHRDVNRFHLCPL